MSDHPARYYCRNISFKNAAKTWGYPLPHLLAMHLNRPEQPVEGVNSHIELYFSTDTVDILGDSLAQLWEELVADPALHIELGKRGSAESFCTVASIEIRTETPPPQNDDPPK